MAMVVAGDGLEEAVAEVVDVPLVPLEADVMLMAVVEKREPVMLRRVPVSGSCWQPASSARRTTAMSVLLLKVSGRRIYTGGMLTICRVRGRTGLQAAHAVVDACPVEGIVVGLAVAILGLVGRDQVSGLDGPLQRLTGVIDIAC